VQKTKQQKLLSKLKKMEQQMVMGNKVVEEAKKNKKELKKNKAELEREHKQKVELEMEL